MSADTNATNAVRRPQRRLSGIPIRPRPPRFRWASRLPLVLLALGLLVWTLLPVYNMIIVALSPHDEVFNGNLYPHHPTLANFGDVVTENGAYVQSFWRQMANSLVVAVITTILVLAIGTLSSFAISRLRPRWGAWVSNAALATYVIPLSFVSIPLYKVMAVYGLLGTQWSLILAMTAFASPYAMWVFSQHSETALSYEIDESARIDGANSWQIYRRIFLPLMTPVLVAIGIYAFLLAWNEYLLAFLLLGSGPNATMPVALSSFLNTDNPPWNNFMAASLFYTLPPAILYYIFRNKIVGGLTAGSVKG